MSGTALGLALGAAALHALWNLLLAGAADTRAATAAALAVGVLVLTPVAALTGTVHAGVWPYVAVSAALETGYFLLLTAAYGRGALSTVYPVARGSAPVLVLGRALPDRSLQGGFSFKATRHSPAPRNGTRACPRDEFRRS